MFNIVHKKAHLHALNFNFQQVGLLTDLYATTHNGLALIYPEATEAAMRFYGKCHRTFCLKKNIQLKPGSRNEKVKGQ